MFDLTRGFKWAIPWPAILSGLTLSAMLPLGLFYNISSVPYQTALLLHLLLLCAAVIATLLFLMRLALSSRWPAILPPAIAAAFIAIILAAGLAPIVDPRALSTDLFVAKQWVMADRIIEIGWHDPSYAPALLLPALSGLMYHSLADYTPAYHLLYLILLCGVVALFVCRRNNDAEAGLIAFVLTLSLPIFVRLAASPGSQFATALFCTIACSSAALWFSPKGRFPDLLVAACALGLGASIGYRGLLVAFLFSSLLLVPALGTKASLGKTTGTLAAYGIISLLICAPWLVRNALWTINPIYPVAKHLFGAVSGTVHFPAEVLRPLPDRLVQYPGTWLDAAMIPLRMILFGKDGSTLHFDGVLSPILLLFLFPIIRIRREPWLLYFYTCVGCYFACAVCTTTPTVSLFTPIFGLMLILCACGVNLLGDLFSERRRFWLYSGIISLQILFGFLYANDLLGRREVRPYLQGKISRGEYLERHIPEYPLIETVNERLPRSGLLYLLFMDNSFYLYTRRITSEGPLRADFLRMLLSSSSSSRLLAKELLNRNISYLMLDQTRSTSILEARLSNRERVIWNRFLANHLETIRQNGKFRLAQISRIKQRQEPPAADGGTSAASRQEQGFQGLVTVE